MIKIGVTGGPASGKTTFVKALSELGVPFISADKIAYDLTEKDLVVRQEMKTQFPEEIFLPDENIDRIQLRKMIFTDPIRRKKLEEILHPPIIREIHRFFMKHNTPKMVAAEVPLLFEANLEAMFDRIVLIKLSDEQMQRRLFKRDDITTELAEDMVAAQWPMEHKEACSHVVIENNGDISELVQKATEFYTTEMERVAKTPETT